MLITDIIWSRCHAPSALSWRLALRNALLVTMAPPEKTTYVSSTGQLSSPPLTKRIAEAVSDLAEVGWLFFDTLFTVSRVPPRN